MVKTVSGLDPNAPDSSWWSSSHRAEQSYITDWSTNNVRVGSDGTVELILDNAPKGAAEPFQGGEINSYDTATTGTFSWTAQVPEMVDGAVFGLFAYRADWKDDPWLEFDFEFVGGDTTQVELTVHMEDEAGNHITNLEKTVVDLGFDASEGFHTYDVVVTGTSAVFRVDGEVIHEFTAEDMPGNVWMTGELKSVVDLWAADPRYDEWTGHWTDPGEPLVGYVSEASVRPGDLSGAMPGTSGPTAPPTNGSGQDTVTVRVSGDAWQGDPNFALTVNGRVVDSTNLVTADHGEGEWDTLVFKGDFNLDGSDRVGIQFTNDHYGWSPSRDRNLYVDSVTVNGETNGEDHTFRRTGTEYWDV